MSRQYNPAIDAYKNMDIENMPKEKPETNGFGLLKRKSVAKSIDSDNAIMRIGKQMELIRKYRNEIKNGD